ncbi:MAG: hypothetical protein ACTSVI_15530 [Promethearchaeota archaeon]
MKYPPRNTLDVKEYRNDRKLVEALRKNLRIITNNRYSYKTRELPGAFLVARDFMLKGKAWNCRLEKHEILSFEAIKKKKRKLISSSDDQIFII